MKNITVLVDTNIFIDVLQDRIPFTDNSQAVIGLVTQKKNKRCCGCSFHYKLMVHFEKNPF
ncbi:MAG: hypothetical protein Q4B64_09135 [Spirochaetales bacterium]|nr:hypothetical protein [Spirochaetales bacterium]